MRSRGLARGRRPNLGYQFLDVAIRFREQVLATDLGCGSFLQQLRGGEASRSLAPRHAKSDVRATADEQESGFRSRGTAAEPRREGR